MITYLDTKQVREEFIWLTVPEGLLPFLMGRRLGSRRGRLACPSRSRVMAFHLRRRRWGPAVEPRVSSVAFSLARPPRLKGSVFPATTGLRPSVGICEPVGGIRTVGPQQDLGDCLWSEKKAV